jgi:hypothetical protein
LDGHLRDGAVGRHWKLSIGLSHGRHPTRSVIFQVGWIPRVETNVEMQQWLAQPPPTAELDQRPAQRDGLFFEGLGAGNWRRHPE